MELLIGALVSGLVQLVKKYFGTTTWLTYLVLATISLLAAAVYYVVTKLGYWEIVYQIVLSAGAIYAFIIRPLTNEK
jgi:hypothetical protein